MIWIFEQEYIHVIIYNKKKIRCSSKCEHLKKLYQNCIWWGQIHFFIYFPLSWIWLNEAEAWTAQFVSHECYSCYCIINSSLSWNNCHNPTQPNSIWVGVTKFLICHKPNHTEILDHLQGTQERWILVCNLIRSNFVFDPEQQQN